MYKTLKTGLEVGKECGQAFYVQTFDQQLHALVQYIKYHISLKLKHWIIRLGSLHITCTYISYVGKMGEEAGLWTLLAQSRVAACKSVCRQNARSTILPSKWWTDFVLQVLITGLFEEFLNLLKKSSYVKLPKKNKSWFFASTEFSTRSENDNVFQSIFYKIAWRVNFLPLNA